jgi:hypothetical protein
MTKKIINRSWKTRIQRIVTRQQYLKWLNRLISYIPSPLFEECYTSNEDILSFFCNGHESFSVMSKHFFKWVSIKLQSKNDFRAFLKMLWIFFYWSTDMKKKVTCFLGEAGCNAPPQTADYSGFLKGLEHRSSFSKIFISFMSACAEIMY